MNTRPSGFRSTCHRNIRGIAWAFASAWFLLAPMAQSQDIPCTPTTTLDRQFRTQMKHRTTTLADSSVHSTTVAQMLGWTAPPDVATFKTRKKDEALSARESEEFAVTGDLWRFIIEENDCDLHLELSAPGQTPTAPRIIVEVPQGDPFVAYRGDVLQALEDHGYTVAVGKSITLDEPIRVIATGYAFYDGAHYSKKNPKKGHNHGTKAVGTLWEIHPVMKITIPEK
jgi:hypothetical protein